MEKLTLNSYAKLNLFLRVINKRKDDYHNISTLFERIDLCDTITITERPDNKIRVICADPLVPNNNSNLCYKSAKLLQDQFKIGLGADIQIEKRIPVGAGLGGGSSNAATVLSGLNSLWKLGLSKKELIRLSAKIGSDVPFFISDCAFALGEGRGEKIIPLKFTQLVVFEHILAVPKIKVSTPAIYKAWDSLHKAKKNRLAGLTTSEDSVKILLQSLGENDHSLTSRLLFNNLEPVTSSLYPEVPLIKMRLLNLGLKASIMSGSGPAVFAIAPSRKEALSLASKLQDQYKSLRVFATRSL